MYNIVIVGAGQLGSRHLQSIKHTTLPCSVFVIDNSIESLQICEQRYNEIEIESQIRSIKFTTGYDDFPTVVDFLLIATNSKVRLNVFTHITSLSKVNNVLFEKVLFPRVDEYVIAQDILNRNSIKAWVNCPRRMYDIYHEIKEEIGSSQLLMSVDGGNWGLGCNSIHQIDLYNFLSENYEYTLDTSRLDDQIIESKRASYVEFTGVLKASFKGGGELLLSSRKDNALQSTITLQSEKGSCIISEALGKCQLIKDGKIREIPFNVPFQSQLTSIVLDSILSNKGCVLVDYNMSMQLHLPFITEILSFINKQRSESSDLCPIT